MSKITNDCLTESGMCIIGKEKEKGIGCFIAVSIWRQWASNG